MTYRTNATELGDARRRVETLVSRIPGGEDAAFDEPWELRAFAMAVAAYDNGCYEWSEFQLSLIESIRSWEDGENATDDSAVDARSATWSYYEHWLAALENVLGKSGALSEAALDDRTSSILTIPKDRNHHEAHREPVAIDPALGGSPRVLP